MATSAAKKIRQYGQNGLSDSRIAESEKERYVTEYAPLIKTVAGRLAMRLPTHVDQNDLLSAGIMGLLDAIEKFDPEKGVASGGPCSMNYAPWIGSPVQYARIRRDWKRHMAP